MSEFNILITDDEKTDAELLATIVKDYGYNAKIVLNGKDALWEVVTDNVGMVLMDGVLKGVSGLESAHAIKRVKPDLSVVMVTGHPEIIDEVSRDETESFKCFMKPFKGEELRKMIESIRESEKRSKSSEPTEAKDRFDNLSILSKGFIFSLFCLIMSVIGFVFNSGIGLIFLYISVFIQSLYYYVFCQITGKLIIRPSILLAIMLGSLALTISSIISFLINTLV